MLPWHGLVLLPRYNNLTTNSSQVTAPTWVNDINDGSWPQLLQVFEEGPSMATVGIGGVYAFCWKVIKSLEVSIHHNFFLICVLEGFGPWYGSFWTLKRKQSLTTLVSVQTEKAHNANPKAIPFLHIFSQVMLDDHNLVVQPVHNLCRGCSHLNLTRM